MRGDRRDAVAALAQSEPDLAGQSQDPVADLISMPLQNNTFFGVGPVNLIPRTIVPVISLPHLTSGLPELPDDGSEFPAVFALGFGTTPRDATGLFTRAARSRGSRPPRYGSSGAGLGRLWRMAHAREAAVMA